MTGTRHAPDVRAKAAAALLIGERPVTVARDLGVPESTVRSWKRRIKNGEFATLKEGDFGGLLLRYLEASLRALAIQSEELADPARLREMRARDAGILFGTLFDRTMRMLDMVPALEKRTCWGEGSACRRCALLQTRKMYRTKRRMLVARRDLTNEEIEQMGRDNPGSAAEYLNLRREELEAEEQQRRDEDDKERFVERFVAAGGNRVDASAELKRLTNERAAAAARRAAEDASGCVRRSIAEAL